MERRLFKNALAMLAIFLVLKGLSGFESHFKARKEFIASSAGRFYPVFSDADQKHVQFLIPENGSPKIISADLQQEIITLSLRKGWKIDNNKVVIAEYQENWKAFFSFLVLCSGVLLGGMLLISLIKTPRYSGIAVYNHLKTIRLNKKLLHPA